MISTIRKFMKSREEKNEFKKLGKAVAKEMDKIKPFHPVRSREELKSQLIYVEEELQKFLVFVKEGSGYVRNFMDESAREMPTIFTLPYLLSRESLQVPPDRMVPYLSQQAKYAKMFSENEDPDAVPYPLILTERREAFIKHASAIANRSAQKILPLDIETEADQILRSSDAWDEASKISETIHNINNPVEFAEKLHDILASLSRRELAKIDYTELASVYFSLNMADYFFSAMFSKATGSENPYAGLFRLCKDGFNVLNFVDVGNQKKLLVNCSMYHNGKPVWGVYIQGENEITHYHKWMDSVLTPARQIDENIGSSYEIISPIPKLIY